MRPIKIVGLAAVTATAIVAFVGATNASASVLLESVICKEVPKEEHCPKGFAYSLKTFDIHSKLVPGTKAVLEAGPIKDECSESLVLGEVTTYGEHSIEGKISEYTFGKCTCTNQVAVHLPWLGKLSPNGSGGGGLLASNGGNGDPGGLVVCAGVHCLYESADVAGVAVTGGNPVIVKARVELSLNTGSSDFFCLFAGGVHWTADYEVISPKPAWFALFLTL